MPGRILQQMKVAASRNPVFMLDEIDKVGADWRGDPSSALLEVLDPEQNKDFSDHYLEVPYDLSQVLFITTANVVDTIIPPLRDRMEIIRLPGYTEAEKMHIARQFLVPRQLREHGLTEENLEFAEDALHALIREYTHEAGVRNLEREIANICRKIPRRIAEGDIQKVIVRPEDLLGYIGPSRFEFGVAELEDQVGAVTGVAVNEYGGDVMTVEAIAMEGKGEFALTGQIGKVMEESARAAVSYARAHAEDLGVKPEWFDEHFFHIHVPAGAIPKDGPSAGITMASAVVSVLTDRPVRRDVAMTGEITLRGKVLPIGGLKEKLLAAHRAGIKIFILPEKNRKDLHEVPDEVKESMELVMVKHIDEVFAKALLPTTAKAAALSPLGFRRPLPGGSQPGVVN
jgi:ATP-dependent Lon protease